MPTPDPGSLIVVGVDGPQLDAPTRRRLADDQVAGVILFTRNAPADATPEAVRASLRTLLAEARACFAAEGLPEPLCMVDHEGGRVHRFGDALTHFPPPGHLAPLGVEAVEEVARQQARELRALGFNTILGPVLDLCPAEGTRSHIAARSYGDDPERTAALGCAAIAGFLAEGLLCVPKHFPSYGAHPVDPHLDLPTRTECLAELEARDLVPFRRALAAGAPALMTAHIVATGLDPELPCTLSPAWLSYVRDALDFDGCVVSDDLCMHSVKDRYGPADLAERCLRAGLDLLLVCHPGPETVAEIRVHLSAVAARDPGFAARLSEAARRVAVARAVATARPPALDDATFAAGAALLARVRG